MGYVPALDGLRAVAISGVILFHLTDSTGGWLGVNMFFVLSGFLITTLLLEEHAAAGRVALGSFYHRRVARLAPALLLAIGTYVVISVISFRADPTRLAGAFRSSLFALASFSNIAEDWNIRGGMPIAISHTWSLSLEDQFYFVWPPLLVLLLVYSSRRMAAIVALALVALVYGHLMMLDAAGAPGLRVAFAPDTASWPLLLGCLAALTVNSRIVGVFQAARLARAFDIFAAIAILYYLRYGPPSVSWDHWGLAMIAFVLIVAGLVVRITSGNAMAGWLETRPMVFLGRISYGLYLWHVILLAEFEGHIPPGFLIIAAVAIAALSYRFIEQPIIRRSRARRARSLEPVAVPI